MKINSMPYPLNHPTSLSTSGKGKQKSEEAAEAPAEKMREAAGADAAKPGNAHRSHVYRRIDKLA